MVSRPPPAPSRRGVLLGAAAAASTLALGAAGCSPTPPEATPATAPPPTSAGVRGGVLVPTDADLDALARTLSGPLLRAGSAGWNPRALSRNARFASVAPPAAIARCADADDVAACVRFAAQGHGQIRLHAGGHSYAAASRGPGLVVDLADLDAVSVDTAAATATVGAGALLVDVYAGVAAHGLALGAGSCPSVGVSGLTLGGGVGVLARSLGLACDQVRSARVVTAEGQQRVVSATSSAARDVDLFWALRGGGGGVAAVVEWTFSLRPAPAVTTFLLVWPASVAAQVLTAWQSWAAAAPRELWSSCRILTGATGARAVVAGTWSRPPGEGTPTPPLASLLAALPAPTTRSVVARTYGAAMLYEAGCSGADATACRTAALAPSGAVPFAATSSILGRPLPEAGAQAAVEAVAAGSGVSGVVESGMAFDALGGAVADVDAASTAVGWRAALATVQHTATWSLDRADADPAPYDALVHAQRQALEPWCGQAAYVNYADAALGSSTGFGQACWGENLTRLQQVRAAEDPDRIFDGPLTAPR